MKKIVLVLFVCFSLLTCNAKEVDNMIRRLQVELIKTLPDTLDKIVERQMVLFDEDGCYQGIDYTNTDGVIWKPAQHYEALRFLAGAYINFSSDYYKNEIVYSTIVTGLDLWYQKDPESANWWWEKIDEQQKIGEILLLMRAGEQKIPEELEDSLISRMETNGGIPSRWTGANRVDIALHWFYRGLLTDDSELLNTSINYIYEPICFNDGGEGFQVDGGFFQHGQQLYLGGYAELFLKSVLKVAICTKGTEFEISQEKFDILSKYMKSTFANIIRGNCINFNCIGRNMSRIGELSRTDVWIPLFKQMKDLDDSDYNYNDIISRLSQSSRADEGVSSYHHHFYKGDYTLHVRPKYSYSIRFSSPRTIQNETLSSENLLGYFISYGGTTIERRGDEYLNIMPLWDWYNVPGVTAPHMEKMPLVNQFYQNGISEFCGGVSDSLYGVSTIKYKDDYMGVNTSATKSWFFFDDEIVCLGSGITSNYETSTSVNQCHANGPVLIYNRDNHIQSFDSLHISLSDIICVFHDSIGYFFPKGGKVEVETAYKEKSWTVVNSDFSDVIEKGNVFKLSINHEVPADNNYEYVVVPGIDEEVMAKYATDSPVRVLQNNSEAQIVYHEKLNIYGAVLYKPTTFGTENIKVQASEPCVLLLNNAREDSLIICVQDLSYEKKNILIKVTMPELEETLCRSADFKQVEDAYCGSTMKLMVGKKLSTEIKDHQTATNEIYSREGYASINCPCESSVRIYNTNGMCVFQKEKVIGDLVIPIYKPGIYVLEINNSGGILKKKFFFNSSSRRIKESNV